MASNYWTAPSSLTFSRSPISSGFPNETQPSKSSKSWYSPVYTSIPNNHAPNIHTLIDDTFEDHVPGNKFLSLLRNVYIDKKAFLQILIFLALFAMTAAVGTCLVLLLIETPGTESSVSNSNQSYASAFNNNTIKKDGYGKSGKHRGVNPNPMNLPVLMTTGQSSTTNVAVRAKLPKSTVATEMATTRKKREILETSTEDNRALGTQKKLSYLNIKSVHDFKEMQANPYINAITVDTLIDDISDKEGALSSYNLENTDNVKHLNVAGSTTEDWLIYLLNKFSRVENLTISIDGLCVESTVTDPDSLESITLENVQHLMIKNSHLCKIMTWVFKWALPKIKQLRIHNSDLTRSTFEPIHTFLEKNKKTLTSVIVSNSFLCPTCRFTKEENTNVGNIKILHEIKNPYLYG